MKPILLSAFGLAMVFGLAFVPLGPARAQSDTTPQSRYSALLKEYSDAMREYSTAARAAKTNEERQKIYLEKYPKPGEIAQKMVAIARANPDSPVALDALLWVATYDYRDTGKSGALDLLADKHAADPKMARIISRLGFARTASAERLMKAIGEQNKDPGVLSSVLYARARSAKESDPKLAETLFKELVEKYPDAKIGSRSAADLAKTELAELNSPIKAGNPAPEIEGKDLDGVAFKLSDYRGQVVLIDFWGDW